MGLQGQPGVGALSACKLWRGFTMVWEMMARCGHGPLIDIRRCLRVAVSFYKVDCWGRDEEKGSRGNGEGWG